MMDFKEQRDVKPEDICLDAVVRSMSRGTIILCASDNPRAGKAPEYPIPVLRKGDVCIASTCEHPLGHYNLTVENDINLIYTCPYRRQE